jgi:hypothetical protein
MDDKFHEDQGFFFQKPKIYRMATKILVGRQYWQFENANGKWP